MPAPDIFLDEVYKLITVPPPLFAFSDKRREMEENFLVQQY